MRILDVQPTPSPHTMKFIFSDRFSAKQRYTYTKETLEHDTDERIVNILHVEGVRSVYYASDWLAIDKQPKADWRALLGPIRTIFGETVSANEKELVRASRAGEGTVYVQYYAELPLQVKVTDGIGEVRASLGEQFTQHVYALNAATNDYLLKREWRDYGVRYGELEDIAAEVAAEVAALYPEERIAEILGQHTDGEVTVSTSSVVEFNAEAFGSATTWQARFRLISQMPLEENNFPLLASHATDAHPSVRRLVVALLATYGERALPVLHEAMTDAAVSVRRTVGDCLSDIGSSESESVMIAALTDESRLVRWRAAMYLYETGTEAALDSLTVARQDEAFEVALQARMAYERIRSGQAAEGSIWKQMLSQTDRA
ncbi:MAG: virulence factor [Bacilli bacterium]